MATRDMQGWPEARVERGAASRTVEPMGATPARSADGIYSLFVHKETTFFV